MKDFSYYNQFAKYWEIIHINYKESVAHVSNVVGSSLIVLLRVWIFAQLYAVTFSISKSAQIEGFSLPMMVWILVLVQSFQSASRPMVAILMQEEIQDGTVSYSLSRPYSYQLFHYFSLIGRAIPKLLLNITVGGSAAYLLVGGISITYAGVLTGLVLLFFGYTLDFLIYYSIGLFSFWLEDVRPICWIYSKAQLVFGGLIIPLALFPEKIQKIAEYLPFSQLYYGASRQIVHPDHAVFVRFLLIQCGYLLIFFFISRFIFAKVLKYITINGG